MTDTVENIQDKRFDKILSFLFPNEDRTPINVATTELFLFFSDCSFPDLSENRRVLEEEAKAVKRILCADVMDVFEELKRTDSVRAQTVRSMFAITPKTVCPPDSFLCAYRMLASETSLQFI